MDIYAQMARDYMDRSGATEEDFAAVSVKAHDHGVLNPKAQYGDAADRPRECSPAGRSPVRCAS